MDAAPYVSGDALAVNLNLQPGLHGKEIEPFTALKVREIYVETVLHQVGRDPKLDLNGY